MRRAIFLAGLVMASAVMGCLADEAPDTSRADGFVESCKALVNGLYGKEVYPSHLESVAAISSSAGYCSGYIKGVFWGSSMVAPQGGKPLFCKPNNVTVEQFAKVLIGDLDKNPALGSEQAPIFVTATLMRHWPCNAASHKGITR